MQIFLKQQHKVGSVCTWSVWTLFHFIRNYSARHRVTEELGLYREFIPVLIIWISRLTKDCRFRRKELMKALEWCRGSEENLRHHSTRQRFRRPSAFRLQPSGSSVWVLRRFKQVMIFQKRTGCCKNFAESSEQIYFLLIFWQTKHFASKTFIQIQKKN